MRLVDLNLYLYLYGFIVPRVRSAFASTSSVCRAVLIPSFPLPTSRSWIFSPFSPVIKANLFHSFGKTNQMKGNKSQFVNRFLRLSFPPLLFDATRSVIIAILPLADSIQSDFGRSYAPLHLRLATFAQWKFALQWETIKKQTFLEDFAQFLFLHLVKPMCINILCEFLHFFHNVPFFLLATHFLLTAKNLQLEIKCRCALECNSSLFYNQYPFCMA